MKALTRAPAEARERVAILWNRARDLATRGHDDEHHHACDQIAEVIIEIHDHQRSTYDPGSNVRDNYDPGSNMNDDSHPGSNMRDDYDPGSNIDDDSDPGSNVRDDYDPGSNIDDNSGPGSSVRDNYDPGSHPGSGHDSISVVDTDEDHQNSWAFHTTQYMGMPTPPVKVSVAPPWRPPAASLVSLGGGVRLRTPSGLSHRRR